MQRTPDILKKILEAKKKRVASLTEPPEILKKKAIEAISKNPPLPFADTLKKDGLALIAEVKKASPSAGIINENFDPAKIAKSYWENSVDAISVLTEEDFFLGKAEYIKIVKENAPRIAVLRKDFIFTDTQIYETAILGADSFLLICAILPLEKLADLIKTGRDLGMEPLVETHSAEEIETAISADAKIIGTNNRNLHDFSVDLNLSLKLAEQIPADKIKVSESGIKNIKDCEKLFSAGFNAVLIGETLMRKQAAKIAEFSSSLKNIKREK